MGERSIIALKPADTPDYMLDAWLGCIHWAIGNRDVLAAFRAETGQTWEPSRSGIGAMVDAATGADWAFLEAFIRWMNVRVWGSVKAPIPDDLMVREWPDV